MFSLTLDIENKIEERILVNKFSKDISAILHTFIILFKRVIFPSFSIIFKLSVSSLPKDNSSKTNIISGSNFKRLTTQFDICCGRTYVL